MDRARFEHLLAHRASRRLVIGAGSAALAAVSLRGLPTRARGSLLQATPVASPVASPTFGASPFSLGVASGDPLPNGIVLWTRLAPVPLAAHGGMDPIPYEVRWEVANDDGFNDVVQSGTAIAAPTLAHAVHVDVTGLEPGREYFYRFMAGSEVSPTGRTKTAPAAGALVDKLRFGFASCSMYEHGYFSAYRHMADQRFDLILHLGDYIYEYDINEYSVREGDPLREHTEGETTNLARYRMRFAQYRTDGDLQAAHAAAPWVVTWDDHEAENDYAGPVSENNDPVAEFLARRADAYQAYYEHMPLRPSSLPQGPDMQLYRRLSYGALAEFSVLDTRQYRSDQPCGDGVNVRCPAAVDPATTLLGPAQERWLLQGLDASSATWNVLAQQVMMAELEQQAGPEEGYWGDGWSGYPAARNRILGHMLNAGTPNPVVITGDIHTAWANDLKADWQDPASATIGTEYICTSITAGGENPATFFEQFLPEAPHVRFFDPSHGGYTAIELTPDLWRADYFKVDALTSEGSGLTPIGSFVTEAGTPGVQQA